jgi:hypothetical protein
MGRSRVNSTEWNCNDGAAVLLIKSLRPFDIDPWVSVKSDGPSDTIPYTQDSDGVFHFEITAAMVQLLKSEPDSQKPPYIKITCGAILSPGAPDRRWGWAFTLIQNGQPLVCGADHGRKPHQDKRGYIIRDPRTFPANEVLDGEFDYVTLK